MGGPRRRDSGRGAGLAGPVAAVGAAPAAGGGEHPRPARPALRRRGGPSGGRAPGAGPGAYAGGALEPRARRPAGAAGTGAGAPSRPGGRGPRRAALWGRGGGAAALSRGPRRSRGAPGRAAVDGAARPRLGPRRRARPARPAGGAPHRDPGAGAGLDGPHARRRPRRRGRPGHRRVRGRAGRAAGDAGRARGGTQRGCGAARAGGAGRGRRGPRTTGVLDSTAVDADVRRPLAPGRAEGCSATRSS